MLLGSAAVASLVLAANPASALAGTIAPDSPASPNATDTQTAYWVMVVLATIVAIAMIVGLLAAVRGRGRQAEAAELRRTRGTNAIQRRVGISIGVLALAVFIFGIVITESTRKVEATGSGGLTTATTAQKDLSLPAGDNKPLEITVSGQQWLWRYEYPDGTFSYYNLVVPVDTEVLLDIKSTDVLHRWWVPSLGPMIDAVPGQNNFAWFKADQVGTYEGRSTEFSGPSYAQMRAQVTVVTPDEYQAWLDKQSADIAAAQRSVHRQVLAGTAPGYGTE